ncbi:hypothetical protein MASR2M29_21800 [Spirochaetota bacterium]
MTNRNRFVLLIIIVSSVLSISYANDAETAAKEEREKRLATINYGIDSQLIDLLSTLKAEKNTEFKNELGAVFKRSIGNKLKIAIFDYFSFIESDLLDTNAKEILLGRDGHDDGLVNSAINYLASIKSGIAYAEYREILETGEKKFYQSAIKALAMSPKASDADLLVSLYKKDDTDMATKESIIRVLGSMKFDSALELLSNVLYSEEAGKAIKMYASTALAELGDKKAVPAMIRAVQGTDPNVRAKAMEALGSFTTEEALIAIREGLRDSHVLVRNAAAIAAGKNRDKEAVAYLEYKALWDPERLVRESSIKALGGIGNKDALDFLSNFIENKKQGVQYRALAMATLVMNGGDEYRQTALSVYKGSAVEKDKSFYTACTIQISQINESSALDFIEVMLADRDFSIRLGAIAWAERNEAKSLLATLKSMLGSDDNEAVRNRAARAVLRLES